VKKLKLIIVTLCLLLITVTPVVCYAAEDEDYSGVTYEEVEGEEETSGSTEAVTTEAPRAVTTEATVIPKVTEQPTTEVTTEAATEATTETVKDEKTTEKVLEEVDESGQPFSVSGNSTLTDDYKDDKTKDFMTITTDSGNSYFIVVDRSGNMDNVYLLSKVDENDLQDFVEKKEEVTTEAPKVVIPEEKEEPEEKEKEEKKESKGANPLTIIVIIGLIGGGIYYFKSKSGKQGKPAPVSENMEDDYEEPDDVEITYQDDPFDKDGEDEDTDE